MNIGDKVGYAAAWLKAVGAPKEISDLVGVFRGMRKIGGRDYARVDWDGGNETKLVVPKYLCVVNSTRHINNDLPLDLERHPSEWSCYPIDPLGQG